MSRKLRVHGFQVCTWLLSAFRDFKCSERKLRYGVRVSVSTKSSLGYEIELQ